MKLAGEHGAIRYYLMVCEQRRYSKYTLIGYTYRLGVMTDLLSSLCGVTELEQVTVLHLRQCVQHLLTTPVDTNKSRRPPENGSTLSSTSVVVCVRAWRAFFNWCYKEELIEKNPITRLENPKEPKKARRAFSHEQAETMFNFFDLSTEQGIRDYVILCLLIDTGLRRAEVVSLCVEDVHDTYIVVEHGKGDKERMVGINPELSTWLWKYINKYRHPRRPDETALFLSVSSKHGGLPFTRGGMQALMMRLKEATGIDNVRLSSHTFRRTFARMYLENGGDLFSLSREMGHTDIRTTQRYLDDFQSESALKHHNTFSPLSRFKTRQVRKVTNRMYPRKNTEHKKRKDE